MAGKGGGHNGYGPGPSGASHYPPLSSTYSGTATPPTSSNYAPAAHPYSSAYGHHAYHQGGGGGAGGAAGASNSYSPGHFSMTGSRTPNGRLLTSLHPPDLGHAAVLAQASRLAEQAHKQEEEDDDEDDEDEDEEEDDEGDSEEDEEEEEEDEIEAGDASTASKKRKKDSTAARAGASDKRKGGPAKGGAKGKGGTTADGKKAKPTRGAKACTHCRRLKMRCVGAENGPPCKRCEHSGNDCIFEESNRGKKSSKRQGQEALQQSLKKMEAKLETVLRSMREPGFAAQMGGMATRSPSPSPAQRTEEGPYIRRGGTPEIYTTRRNVPRDVVAKLTAEYSGTDVDDFGNVVPKGDKAGAPEDTPASANGTAAPPSNGAESKQTEDGRPNDSSFALDPSILGAAGNASNSNAAAPAPGSNKAPSTFAGSPEAGASGTAASNASKSPAASSVAANTTQTHGTRFVEPMPRYHRDGGNPPMPQKTNVGRYRSSSPRLHALPDNTLNPLGLLAEASLHSSHKARKTQGRVRSASTSTTDKDGVGTPVEERAAIVGGKGGKAGSAPAANASGKGKSKAAAGGAEEAGPAVPLGVANETYFKPGPMTILPLRQIIIERELPVEVLTLGIVSSEEVLDLFRIFFHSCMQHVFMLDPDWHTPTFLCGRSPFLFTCVCTVAAKFYPRRPDLHEKCFAYAKKCAFEILDNGYKSVEIVQGFLLLSMWCQPSTSYEQDTAWLFSGIAIRIATDLNLHRKSLASLPGRADPDDPAVIDREREIMNRERTWFICFAVDRNLSGQMGKPYTIREDWLIRNCRHWCLQRLSKPWDVGISALVELLRIHSRQIDFLYSSTASVSGLNMDIDYPSVLRTFNEQLDEWRELWRYRGLFQNPAIANRAGASAHNNADNESEATASASASNEQRSKATNAPKPGINKLVDEIVGEDPPPDDADHTERTMYFLIRQAPIRFNYVVLIINSFGLQHSLDHPTLTGLDKPQYYMRCLTAARGIIDAAFSMGSVLRYAPDSQFVMIAYASVFLLKLIRPVFANFCDEDEVVRTVSKTADWLEEVSVSETHTPALYATFLRTLLQSRLEHSTGGKSGANTPRRAGSPSMDAQTAHNTDVNGQSSADGDQMRAPPVSGGITMMPGGRDDLAINTMYGMDSRQMLQAVNTNTDQLLNDSFWSSLLPPGFGGPIDGTGGSGGLDAANLFRNHQQNFHATPSATPGQTRPSTPSMMHSFPAGLDFGLH